MSAMRRVLARPTHFSSRAIMVLSVLILLGALSELEAATLSAPVVSAVTDVYASSMTATWGLVSAATGYTLAASTESVNPPGTIWASSVPVGIDATTATVFSPGLDPNTTYFLFVRANGNGESSAYSAYPAASTLARPPGALAFSDAFPSVQITTVSVAWGALPLAPPEASSMTSEGYLLEISSTNFGVLLPGGVINSSATANVAESTLTVAFPDPAATTNYYRVSSLNWEGRKNTLQIGKMNFQILQSTGLVGLGSLTGISRSTVSISSMVVYNVGDLPASFILSAATATSPSSSWSLSTSSGVETATLQGVWNNGPPAPPASAFTTFLTTTPRLSGGGGGHYAGDQTGAAVPAGSSRTLWFYFWAPASTLSTSPETIRVRVDAVKP